MGRCCCDRVSLAVRLDLSREKNTALSRTAHDRCRVLRYISQSRHQALALYTIYLDDWRHVLFYLSAPQLCDSWMWNVFRATDCCARLSLPSGSAIRDYACASVGSGWSLFLFCRTAVHEA